MARHGDWPCCGVAGTGTDAPVGLKWGPESWAGWGYPREGWAVSGRADGAMVVC